MPVSLVALLGLWLAGCCGGYAVVQTRVSPVPPASRDPGATGGHLLHYSRVGEPPNSCGSNEKYVEDLYIRIPSLRAGQAHAIGGPGVSAAYTRTHGAQTESTKAVRGTVSLVELQPGGVVASLDVTVSLQAGEAVTIRDEYTFHPAPRGE